ncbi:MAG: winged helix-turn-helix transcriptional regulator [Candidatus Thermoplasmatota archaeon]|nr:winged helix-turn-helix transcriptional regulator [Candidatus Thermoplasmatota archaeon]
MKAVKLIKDPQSFNLLADDTRRRMIHLLRAKERTVSQIAEELGLTPQAIYHHIRKMKEGDLVEVAKEERVDHFIETYYRATAEVFIHSHGEGSGSPDEEREIRSILENMPKIGLDIPSDKETISKVISAASKLKACSHESAWYDKVSELEDVDFFAKQGMAEYACIATMSDKDFEAFLENYRNLRKVLKSGVQAGIKKKG